MTGSQKTKLRLKRLYRKKQRQVEDLGVQAEDGFDKLVIKRLDKMVNIWRFVTSWSLLIILLSGIVLFQVRGLQASYLSWQPSAGGSYSEGMVGGYTNANPLYASSTVDNTVSRLLFSGLLTYDTSNKLVGDLAESWTIDDTDTVYTVKLLPQIKWHDGQTVTADDVVFTFNQVKNPDTKSPLFQSWRSVKIEKIDNRTVKFTLPSPFAPFAHSLTTGIIPRHILEAVPASQFRSAQFNTTKPVGSGPFTWNTLQTTGATLDETWQQVSLRPYDNYHRGAPKLEEFTVKTYPNESMLVEAFKSREVDALAGMTNIPEEVNRIDGVQTYTPTITAEVAAFLRNDSEILSDVSLRQALVQSTDTKSVLSSLGFPTVVANGPFLESQSRFSSGIDQLEFDIESANKLFDKSGWIRPSDGGTRTKGDKKLTLSFVLKDTADQVRVAKSLQDSWKKVGVDIQLIPLNNSELQDKINSRNYDILLYGIAIGQDPDVFAYWHSSQFDPRSSSRLNFSDYKSTKADDSLISGRSRTDAALRTAKYKPFLEAWRNDAPAIVFYQPSLVYVTHGPVYGFDVSTVNSAADRFVNVQNWMVNQELQNIAR